MYLESEINSEVKIDREISRKIQGSYKLSNSQRSNVEHRDPNTVQNNL
jgi:hypothetical protein